MSESAPGRRTRWVNKIGENRLGRDCKVEFVG